MLRPGGTLGLVWNERDEEVPWTAELGRIVEEQGRKLEADEMRDGNTMTVRGSARRSGRWRCTRCTGCTTPACRRSST